MPIWRLRRGLLHRRYHQGHARVSEVVALVLEDLVGVTDEVEVR